MGLADDLRADTLAFLDDGSTTGIEGLGRSMRIERTINGTYDPTTGESTPAKVVKYTGRGRIGNYSDYLRATTLLRDEDRRCTFIPDDITFEPFPNDVMFVDNDERYSVVTVSRREINGNVICFTMKISR